MVKSYNALAIVSKGFMIAIALWVKMPVRTVCVGLCLNQAIFHSRVTYSSYS